MIVIEDRPKMIFFTIFSLAILVVYQMSTRSTTGKSCGARLSGGSFFVVFRVGLPDVYQSDFLREKPAGFSLFSAF